MTRIHRSQLQTVSVRDLREALLLVPNARAVTVAGQRIPVVKVWYAWGGFQYRCRCPRCARTCDKLVVPDLKCLKCVPHTYQTYRGTAAERQAVADKIRQRLGWPEHELDGPRPKYMRKHIFAALVQRYHDTLKRSAQNDKQLYRRKIAQRQQDDSVAEIIARYNYTPALTVEERRARALERLDAAQLALMPAATAGNGAAAHALAKLIAQEAALVPSMAAPVMGGGQVNIQIAWLENSGRLSYADQDEVASGHSRP